LRNRGFTLLEIIVAVAVLGVSVGIALQIFSGGLNNVRRIELAHGAMNHAENVMNEILSDQDLISPVQLSGDLDEEFRYTATVDYWEPPRDRLELDLVPSRVDLLSVVVDIHFKNDRFGKRYRAVCLKAVSLEPPPGEGPPLDPIRQLFGGRR
jgi:prepilin-type N-terminal cleavage/methylation domain-containing protein